jgi:hypothetical protein
MKLSASFQGHPRTDPAGHAPQRVDSNNILLSNDVLFAAGTPGQRPPEGNLRFWAFVASRMREYHYWFAFGGVGASRHVVQNAVLEWRCMSTPPGRFFITRDKESLCEIGDEEAMARTSTMFAVQLGQLQKQEYSQITGPNRGERVTVKHSLPAATRHRNKEDSQAVTRNRYGQVINVNPSLPAASTRSIVATQLRREEDSQVTDLARNQQMNLNPSVPAATQHRKKEDSLAVTPNRDEQANVNPPLPAVYTHSSTDIPSYRPDVARGIQEAIGTDDYGARAANPVVVPPSLIKLSPPAPTNAKASSDPSGARAETLIERLGDHDVLLGTGNHLHPGNHRFQLLADERRSAYRSAARPFDPNVVARVISAWRSQIPPGRFLKRQGPNGKWSEAPADLITKKTVEALLVSSSTVPSKRSTPVASPTKAAHLKSSPADASGVPSGVTLVDHPDYDTTADAAISPPSRSAITSSIRKPHARQSSPDIVSPKKASQPRTPQQEAALLRALVLSERPKYPVKGEDYRMDFSEFRQHVHNKLPLYDGRAVATLHRRPSRFTLVCALHPACPFLLDSKQRIDADGLIYQEIRGAVNHTCSRQSHENSLCSVNFLENFLREEQFPPGTVVNICAEIGKKFGVDFTNSARQTMLYKVIKTRKPKDGDTQTASQVSSAEWQSVSTVTGLASISPHNRHSVPPASSLVLSGDVPENREVNRALKQQSDCRASQPPSPKANRRPEHEMLVDSLSPTTALCTALRRAKRWPEDEMCVPPTEWQSDSTATGLATISPHHVLPASSLVLSGCVPENREVNQTLKQPSDCRASQPPSLKAKRRPDYEMQGGSLSPSIALPKAKRRLEHEMLLDSLSPCKRRSVVDHRSPLATKPQPTPVLETNQRSGCKSKPEGMDLLEDSVDESSPVATLVECPGDHDVIMGMGSHLHVGNQLFLVLAVDGRKDAYQNACPPERHALLAQLIATWRDQMPPGRFLKRQRGIGVWCEASADLVMKKAIEALTSKIKSTSARQGSPSRPSPAVTTPDVTTPEVHDVKDNINLSGKTCCALASSPCEDRVSETSTSVHVVESAATTSGKWSAQNCPYKVFYI